MKYPLIAAVLVVFALSACGEPKPGQYPPGFMDEREGMDELDAALQETAKEEKTVLDTIEEAVEDAIEAVEETVEDAIEAVEETFDDDEAEDDDVDDVAEDNADDDVAEDDADDETEE